MNIGIAMAQGFVDVPEPNEQVNEWIRFGMKLAVSSALHPFEYAKVLIQVWNNNGKIFQIILSFFHVYIITDWF